MFFFGPESEKYIPDPREPVIRPSSSHRVPSPESSSLQVPKKQIRETSLNGFGETPPQTTAKRSRKTNAERNGQRKTSATPVTIPGMGMDVDVVNGHALSAQDARSPSATEGYDDHGITTNGIRLEDRMDVDTDGELQPDIATEVRPPIMHTLSTGESIGIQVAPAKVADLIPSTTIMDVHGNQQLTQSVWSPHEQSMLTSRGDTTCGVWRYSPTASKPSYQELLGYSETDGALVTALAWEPSGSLMAVATCTQGFGELHLFDGRSLDLLETLPASQRAILKLQFQGLRLAGLAPYDDESERSTILLWNLANGLSAEPQSISVPETLEDIDYVPSTPAGAIFAAGGSVIYEYAAYPELAFQQKIFTSTYISPGQLGERPERWAFIKASPQRVPGDDVRPRGPHFIVAASSETGAIWASPWPSHVKEDAHQAPITGLQKRPSSAQGAFEFATSSEDGSVKVWRLQSMFNAPTTLQTLATLTFGQPMVIKTLSYSPDGFCLAAASNNSVRIWNAEHGYNQMASWQAPAEWKGNHIHDDDLISNGAMSGVNGDGMASAVDHSLTWNPDSKKIAFGLGSQVSGCQLGQNSRLTIQVALINFQR
jgi:WD40 repeat protein